MPVEMPSGLPFAVDTWSAQSDRKRHHFLTHAHRDHLSGILSHAAFPIYATRVTKTLVLHFFPRLQGSLFVEIEVGESMVIDDPAGAFTVSAFDANHCPGAVMFLFEGEFGAILHTGDCRLTPDSLHNLPLKYISRTKGESAMRLSFIFLDCTFCRCHLKLPSKQQAVQQVINLIWKHPHAPVIYLACDLLGHEEILVEVSRIFMTRIYVDKAKNPECYQNLLLVAPEIISPDSSSRFQLIGMHQLHNTASEKLALSAATLLPKPLFIRPSTQWYAMSPQSEKMNLAEGVLDEFGIWHVCFSIHSSRDELEHAMQVLQPQWVISTTPPCYAMELSYVKKHCFRARLGSDDPVWKLFKNPVSRMVPVPGVIEFFDSSTDATASVTIVSGNTMPGEEVLPEDASINSIQLELHLSQEVPKEPEVTLFGRARFGLEEYEFGEEGNGDCTLQTAVRSAEVDTSAHLQRITLQVEEPANTAEKAHSADQAMVQCGLSSNGNGVLVGSSDDSSCLVPETEVEDFKRDFSCIGSSTKLNACLRKLYRSRNIPVPRPLPSLTKLMEASKRVKIASCTDCS